MISVLSYFFSTSNARKISWILRWMVVSFSPVTFLISCWVSVEPPKLDPEGTKKLYTAERVRLVSTPVCSQKR